MKKTITIILLFISAFGFGQKKDSIPPQAQPIVILRFTLHDLQVLYDNLDQSTGNHLEVSAMLKYIAAEANKQIAPNSAPKK